MSDEKTVHTEPDEVLDDHIGVIQDAISAPLPGGSAAPSDDKGSEKAEGKEKAA
jgi:hypothetical protein